MTKKLSTVVDRGEGVLRRGTMVRKSALAGLFLLLTTLLAVVGSSNAKPDKSAEIWKEDIQYIKCGVCEEIAKQVTRQVKEKREKAAPKKPTEFEVIEVAERICDVKRDEGNWIAWLDMVQKGGQIQLVEQDKEGECNSECKTIQKACEMVMGEHDTDVAEAVYAGSGRAALSQMLCRDLSRVCRGPTPKVPKSRTRNEEFTPNTKAEVDKLMRSMQGVPGAPGMKAYSREDLLSGKSIPGMEEFEDEDEDDDEDSPRAKMRAALQSAAKEAKESAKTTTGKQTKEAKKQASQKDETVGDILLEKITSFARQAEVQRGKIRDEIFKAVDYAWTQTRSFAQRIAPSAFGSSKGKGSTKKSKSGAKAAKNEKVEL